MKKIFFCAIQFLLALSLILPVYAEFKNPPIVDKAEYLMQSEVAELKGKLDTIRQKYNFDVVIYTEHNMSSATAEASADDIYDYNGYGAGENDDGIMLYICSDTREYHFTTHGRGLDYFNANGLAYMESMVLPHLSDDNYYEAFEVYIETAEELLEMAAEGTPYNKKQYSTKYLAGVVGVCLIAPLLIAFAMMKKKLKMMKTAVENNYAADYQKPGSMKLDVSRDIFMYSHITKTEKQKSDSDTHTSSSGRTHGGRGGSF